MPIILAVLLLLLLLPKFDGQAQNPLLVHPSQVRTERVALFPDQPDRKRLGALTCLGGLRLSSFAPGFGGFSGMAVQDDQFTLLSDGGNIVRFRMGSDWRIHQLRFGALPDGPGAGMLKEDRDSESLARDPRTGQFWVGFELHNEIWRYSADLQRAERRVAPRAMEKWSIGFGAEAMALLPGGRMLVIAEDLKWVKGSKRRMHPGIVFAGDPTINPNRGFRFHFLPPAGGWRITEVAVLPDGRLLALVRRAAISTGFVARLLAIDTRAIRPGAIVEGKTLAEFRSPALHDNFEAMAVTRENGATIVWIASDDNESIFQQNLLLKFRLDETAEPENMP